MIKVKCPEKSCERGFIRIDPQHSVLCARCEGNGFIYAKTATDLKKGLDRMIADLDLTRLAGPDHHVAQMKDIQNRAFLAEKLREIDNRKRKRRSN